MLKMESKEVIITKQENPSVGGGWLMSVCEGFSGGRGRDFCNIGSNL